MPNMSMTKLPMPEQDPKVRARNFEEVSYGYTEEMAVEEAQRCLNCKHMREKYCLSLRNMILWKLHYERSRFS